MEQNARNTHGWLTGLLTGWGIKESWAKLIAGAVVGALAAAGLLSSCEQVQSITPEQIQGAASQVCDLLSSPTLGRWHKAAHVATDTECKYRVIQVEEVEK